MNILDNDMLYRQFAASIDMLAEALRDCPDDLWTRPLWSDQPGQFVDQGFSAFWRVAYHALFWLDLYLYGAEEGFAPPEPFDLVEMEPDGAPPRTYSRAELLAYLDDCRSKCRLLIQGMTTAQASRLCRFPWGEVTFAELQLYNMRHVQEHGAQLRMFIGQQAGKAAKWVARGK